MNGDQANQANERLGCIITMLIMVVGILSGILYAVIQITVKLGIH